MPVNCLYGKQNFTISAPLFKLLYSNLDPLLPSKNQLALLSFNSFVVAEEFTFILSVPRRHNEPRNSSKNEFRFSGRPWAARMVPWEKTP